MAAQLKYLIKIIVVLAVGLYLFIFLIFKGLSYNLYLKQVFAVKDSSCYDVWITGSSNVLSSVCGQDLFKDIGLRSYNMGENHAGLHENFLLLKLFAEHHPDCRLLILGVNPCDFATAGGRDFPELYLIVNKEQRFLSLISKADTLFPLAFQGWWMKAGLGQAVSPFGDGGSIHAKGFEGFQKYLAGRDFIADKWTQSESSDLDSILSFCSKKNISVWVFETAMDSSFSHIFFWRSERIENIKTRVKLAGATWKDFPALPEEYFSGVFHLNDAGRKEFTRMLSDSLGDFFLIKRNR